MFGHNFRDKGIIFTAGLLLLLGACTPREEDPSPTTTPGSTAPLATVGPAGADERAANTAADRYSDLEIVTLLPRDAIPAIDNPQFLTAEEANDFYSPDELVLGVEFKGDARAYSIPFLSSHEIVNDTVGGVPIAVTW